MDDAGAVNLSEMSNFNGTDKILIVSKMEGIHSRLSDFPFVCGFQKLSEQYRKLLGIEFPSQEKDVDLNNNFCDQPSNDYTKFRLNQKDNIYHCSRRDQKK